MSEKQKLRARFAKMKEAGLVDVHFCSENLQNATVESVCAEVNEMYAAIDAGHAQPLDFGDLSITTRETE